MFFFCDEGTEEATLLKFLSMVRKGIFFVDSSLVFNPEISGTILFDPPVHWVSDFNAIYEALLFKIGANRLPAILATFKKLKTRYSEVQLVKTLLHLRVAREVEYTQREVLDLSENLFKILEMCETDVKSGFYKLLIGSQKKKVVFLSLLISINSRGTQNKTIIFLKYIDRALCATTHYLQTSLVIKFLSFLELTRSPALVIIPCDAKVRYGYEQMCKYIQSDFVHI